MFKNPMARWLVALAATTCASVAGAQAAFPDKPVRLVVGFAPGGPADSLARIVANGLTSAWPHPTIVENKPGAGGTIAAAQVAKAAPDGYTLLLVTSGHAGNGAYYRNVPYDTVKSFAPVSGVAASPGVVVVAASSPYQSLADLIADARKRPGRINYGSTGGATLPALAAHQLKATAKIDATEVAYKGTGPALTAVLGGEVDAVMDIVSNSEALIRAGRLRGLAVTSAQRSSVLPQVPTVAEQGFPGFDITGWFGVLAPAGTPPEVVRKLNAEIRRVMTSAAVREQIAGFGAEPITGTPAEFGRFLESETQRWSALIRQLQLKAD